MKQLITVYYQGNKHPALEERILDAARRYQAQITGEFTFSEGEFGVMVSFKNEGQIDNFSNDLNLLQKAFQTKIIIGGVV